MERELGGFKPCVREDKVPGLVAVGEVEEEDEDEVRDDQALGGDLKSSGMQGAYRGMQRHAEEFRSKKGGTFQAELSMFKSFFRNRRQCRNNSFKNYLYITEKGLPNTTWR